MKNRMFVLFVNDNGFVADNGAYVNNVTKAHVFASRELAEKHRSMIYDQYRGVQNTISILEWL